jgi:hypothetical protein
VYIDAQTAALRAAAADGAAKGFPKVTR